MIDNTAQLQQQAKEVSAMIRRMSNDLKEKVKQLPPELRKFGEKIVRQAHTGKINQADFAKFCSLFESQGLQKQSEKVQVEADRKRSEFQQFVNK